MSTRARLLIGLCTAALIVAAVIALRTPDDRRGSPDTEARPVTVDRYATEAVILPTPGKPPAAPRQVVASIDTSHMRLSWADGLPGGRAPARATGYEVRWHRDGEEPKVRLVSTPDTLLTGLTNGEHYQVEVRSVDAYGQRSAPARTSAVPRRAARAWRDGLTGTYDEFTEPPDRNRADSAWHLSGGEECQSTLSGPRPAMGLSIETGCGSGSAVLRARQPLRLTEPRGERGVLGRVAVLTDAAAPGAQLTIDLVTGPADRVGTASRRAPPRDPSLPAGTVRVAVDDAGARVVTAPEVPTATPTRSPAAAPRRGPGVPHLFEVELTTSGVLIYQDGLLIGVGAVVPSWREATVLVGMRGPGRTVRVHVAAAGFTGEPTGQTNVVEVPVSPSIERVLDLTEPATGGGFPAVALRAAGSARLVATLSTTPSLDPAGVVIQLGGLSLPARPAAPVAAGTNGAALTVVADVPLPLPGPDPVSPLVVRAPGATVGAVVLESYLEIVPGPGWTPPFANDTKAAAAKPVPDPLPDLDVTLSDASGEPLSLSTVPRHGQLVLTINLNATIPQWRTGAVAGVVGLEVRLDGTLIAGVPTTIEGPSAGGEYTMSIAVSTMTTGSHRLEIRHYGTTTAVTPGFVLRTFTVR